METVVIPIELAAFVLTPKCGDIDDSVDKRVRIAPITQPNYIGLRLDEALMQHDLVDHIDLHGTDRAETNPRLADIGAANKPAWRDNRMGVYLHWSLPRCYRAARRTKGDQTAKGTRSDTESNNTSVSTFPTVPNRWLVVRRLTAQSDGNPLPEFQTWVVESNRVRKVQDLDDSVDLEVDTSPFMRAGAEQKDDDWKDVLERQAEIFIGKRNEHSGWREGTAWSESETGDPNQAEFMDLTVLGSSNPVFPDYVPHNGGVFSIIDSFKYKDLGGNTKHLTGARADYFVIGWNSLTRSDLVTTSDKLSTNLDNLNLALNIPDNASTEIKTKLNSLLGSTDARRSLLHGSIYSVHYQSDARPAAKAQQLAEKFGPKFVMEPLSAGVSPIDAIITFLRAHKDPSDIEQIFDNTKADKIAANVLALGDLLYAGDDSFNERVKAQDINAYQGQFAKSTSAGYRWDFAEKSGTGSAPKSPTSVQMGLLLEMNQRQAILDSQIRLLGMRRWDLFSLWWKYASDKTNINRTMQSDFAHKVDDLKGSILDLERRVNDGHTFFVEPLKNKSFKRVNQDSFFTRREPTVCVAGVPSGFATDPLASVPVRVGSNIDSPQKNGSDAFNGKADPFPAEIRDAALKLLGEGMSHSNDDFKDRVTANAVPGFQSWKDMNPFQPMFVEWEALYYHIDRSKWTVGVHASPVGLPTTQVRYGVKELLANNADNQKDFRYIRGRSLILPQPTFSLRAAIESVLDSQDPSISLSQDDKENLLADIDTLPFISCPLSGFQEHLLTRVMGTHVKPTVNRPGKSSIPLAPAARSDVGLGSDTIKLIDMSSDLTPYGNLMNFDPATYVHAPFKGITHGQLMLTKFNIVDKFGQVIALPIPTPKRRNPPKIPDSVHPCLSDMLIPDLWREKTLNTIYAEDKDPDHGKWPLCRFMQIPPSINQNTRVNASFVTRSTSPGSPFWRETEFDKPESPVVGWVIVNYQNAGLQFFLPDGRFYREIRIGGPLGASTGSKWLPFDPPQNVVTNTQQLDELLAQLQRDGGVFLRSFFHMINEAIKTMPYPPSEYAGYANALVGKPLALVNVGFSLELATPALKAQNTLGKLPTDEQAELSSYRFPFKLGDADRPFDGVVGFFDTDNDIDKGTGSTEWGKIFTYFPDDTNVKQTRLITPENYLRLSPYYIDPVTLQMTSSTKVLSDYRSAQAAQFKVKSMLIDPYTALHAYSPSFPIKSLQLPPWCIQQAFTRMTAFFRLGPNLVSIDVPPSYDAKKPLNPDSWITAKTEKIDNNAAPLPAVRLPISGRKGLWKWLQPYAVTDAGATVANTRYNELEVQEEDSSIRLDMPPYTFVEGYLQLARPLLKEDVTSTST